MVEHLHKGGMKCLTCICSTDSVCCVWCPYSGGGEFTTVFNISIMNVLGEFLYALIVRFKRSQVLHETTLTSAGGRKGKPKNVRKKEPLGDLVRRVFCKPSFCGLDNGRKSYIVLFSSGRKSYIVLLFSGRKSYNWKLRPAFRDAIGIQPWIQVVSLSNITSRKSRVLMETLNRTSWGQISKQLGLLQTLPNDVRAINENVKEIKQDNATFKLELKNNLFAWNGKYLPASRAGWAWRIARSKYSVPIAE